MSGRLGLGSPTPKPLRSTPTLTPPRPRAWPLNSSHAPARAAPALRCGCTLVRTPRQVFKKKSGLFLSHDLLGARRCGLGTRRPSICTIPARACEDTVAVPRAATGGACCADRFAAHTLRRQQRYKKKTPKSHSPEKSCLFFPRCSSPVALCIAGGRG
jgi:hypothetical protein